MSYLLDTNILSELRKRERAHPDVISWASSVASSDLHTSVLVIGEIRRGIALRRLVDPAQAAALEGWLEKVRAGFGDRILPVDEPIAALWGGLSPRHPLPVIDALLAATAMAHGLTLVTRNVRDVARSGVALLDPFSATR